MYPFLGFRFKPLTIVFVGNLFRHGVQLEAHVSCQWQPLVLVLPRGKDEETPFSTCLVILMAWAGELIETPRREEDDWQTYLRVVLANGLPAGFHFLA